MQPILKKASVNGVELAYFERGNQRDDAPTLLFVHATGFHARLWDHIAEAFPTHHIIALEQRGHGRSSKVAVDHWRTFSEDQAAFVNTLGLTKMIGIAHSMGAHGLIDAAFISGAFSRLLLLDPTVVDPAAYSEDYASDFGDELHPAAKRRNVFASVEDMYARLSTKSSFPLFLPRILRDYCEYGLEQTESGEYVLACEPEIEAHVYMTARSNGAVYDSVRGLDIPVTIIRAKLPAEGALGDFSSSPTWPGLVHEFPHAREMHWADCSHFIPMQRPDDVIALIEDEISSWRQEQVG